MRNQIVQWVFLPAGLTADGHLAASVFVSPRLRSDEGSTLSDFPDFADWPATLNTADFAVTLQLPDGTTEAPMHIMRHGRSELWQALFPPTTPIRSFEFDDYADRPLVTYPLVKVLDHLQGLWATLAARTPDELPLSTTNASPIGPALDLREPQTPILATHFETIRNAGRIGILEGVENAEQFSDRLEATLRGAAAAAAELRAEYNLTPQPMIEPYAQGDNPSGNLYRLMGFHRRPDRPPASFPQDQQAAAAELQEKMEFHHLLSTLGDHPALLRALGLVFDLIVRPDFVPTTDDQDPPSSLRVLIERHSDFPPMDNPPQSPWNVDVFPWSLVRLTDVEGQAFFSAAERSVPSRRFAHGFVRADPARFAAVAVDVDGLALKAFNMAATLTTQEEKDQRPIEEPAESGTPTPRTGGVALVHTGHAGDLHDEFYQARANDDALNGLDPDDPPTLAAEDLVRGYRMDVLDGGAWRSLHQRKVEYRPQRLPEALLEEFQAVLDVEDEGTAQISLSGEVSRPAAPADPDGALYAHEALFTWDGWSLAAKRPERAIPQEPAAPEAAADLGALNLDIKAKARPGSLPLLRFGRDYSLRVRTVDLAGNAHTLDNANNLGRHLDSTGLADYRVSLPSDPLVYRRYEPVSAPELVPRKRFGPGEGLERLVVRSNFDTSAEDYAAASQAAPDETLRFFAFCDRHVAAAKASLQLTELHGMFDDALAAVRDLSPEDATAAIQDFYAIASRESGSFRDVPGAVPVVIGEHLGQSQGYVVIDADDVELPYLPDPFCGGAVIRLSFAPASPEEHILEFKSDGGWHEPRPVRLRLEEGASAFAGLVDPGSREFVIRLPRGRTARLRMYSLLAGDPELFGILEWCRAKLSAADADKVLTAISESRHWMTTPWRTVELIHAVQQPLQEPGMELNLEHAPAFRRQRDSTAAALSGRVNLDVPSSARLDLVADWNDVVDDPAAGLLDVNDMVRHIHTSVFSVPLPEPFGTPWAPEIDYFLRQLGENDVEFHTASPEQETPEQIRRLLLEASAQAGVTVQERYRLAAAASHLEGLRQHDFGDTKYRRVGYQMIASTRFREYFDPQMPVEDGQRRGDVQTVEMLSSARPPTPAVIDVVPILSWTDDGALETGRTSIRHGVGLRVWLRRPWFASGAGELLGVVCSNDGIVGTNSPEYREITYIARDPAHGGIVPLPIGADSLAGAAVRVESITVPTSGGPVTAPLAGFKPRYDRGRDAWYCDLKFDTGMAYLPFVRLGLVRYQPKSIPGCEVSPIIATSFVQTLPDRTLTVIRQNDSLTVRMHGPAPRSRRKYDGTVVEETNVVAAVIEEQDPRARDVEVGWFGLGAEIILTAEIADDGSAVWSGDVPIVDAEVGGARRLCVREFELHPADSLGDVPGTLIEGRRLVHADVIALDA